MTAPAKYYDKGKQFVIDTLTESANRYGSFDLPSVNMLDQKFVDDFIAHVGCPMKYTMFGANKCRVLGQTLSAMMTEGILTRSANGITGLCGQGFPRWVWAYRFDARYVKAYGLKLNKNNG